MRLRLVGTKTEATDVLSFIFAPEEPLRWKAGQFLHFALPHKPIDERGDDRWFTISSAPQEKRVVITTRVESQPKESSFKKALRTLKAGSVIEIADIGGDFILGDIAEEYVFIAGGIGITPFRSMLMEAWHAQTPLHATLLYANRDTDIIYKEELGALEKNNLHLVIRYIISPEHISETLIKSEVPNLQKAIYYISGPDSMVESVGNILTALGIAKERIKQDWFSGYEAQ